MLQRQTSQIARRARMLQRAMVTLVELLERHRTAGRADEQYALEIIDEALAIASALPDHPEIVEARALLRVAKDGILPNHRQGIGGAFRATAATCGQKLRNSAVRVAVAAEAGEAQQATGAQETAPSGAFHLGRGRKVWAPENPDDAQDLTPIEYALAELFQRCDEQPITAIMARSGNPVWKETYRADKREKITAALRRLNNKLSDAGVRYSIHLKGDTAIRESF